LRFPIATAKLKLFVAYRPRRQPLLPSSAVRRRSQALPITRTKKDFAPKQGLFSFYIYKYTWDLNPQYIEYSFPFIKVDDKHNSCYNLINKYNFKRGSIMAKDKRFIKVYSQSMGSMEIWVDKETGVNYLYRQSGYSGGLTVLLDKYGKPLITTNIQNEDN
jgi:hypothetical protein